VKAEAILHKISSRRVAMALGRAAAAVNTDEERAGIAMAIHFVANEIAIQDWAFDTDEFRSEADAAYADATRVRERQRVAGETLARIANYKPPVV